MRRSALIGAVVGAGVVVTSVPGLVAGAGAATKHKPPKPKIVNIHDNYFDQAKVTVVPDQKVTWKWPADLGDTHDITSVKTPKGVKKFQSPPYAVGAKWSEKFTKPGTYTLECSFHPTEMTMTVVVKKK